MARFPTRESEVVILAQDVFTGIKTHPETYSNPPITIAEAEQILANYIKSRDASIDAQAAATECIARKQEAFDALVNCLKVDVNYCEAVAPDKLGQIGWSGHSPRSSVPAPSSPRMLESLEHGNGAITMDWKSGREGGRPNAYEVQRRELPQSDWQLIATAIHPEISLENQPRNTPLEYRIIARNGAGSSPASNTLSVSL